MQDAGESTNKLGPLQRVGLRLFPKFGQPETTVQRLVGIIGGVGTIVVGVINSINYGFAGGLGFAEGLLSSYTGLILMIGIISIGCGFWDHAVARSAHIALFVFSGIFGAVSANRGNITSAFFLVFAIILLVEYRVNRKLAWGLAILMLAGYVAALSVGYQDDVARPVVSAFSSLVTVLVFVGLFGGVTLRHRLLLTQNAAELENRIQQRTADLNNALSERTVMLQEIHHRVKNNMQTISTLLGMEADKLADPEARRVLSSSQQRIQAMAGLHDALYRSDRLDRVDLSDYARDLVDTILQTAISPIELTLNVEGAGTADLSLAVSLGLALNELVSNALKHAFNTTSGGRLGVSLAVESDCVVLEVDDNGKGLPADFDIGRNGRVGMSVVSSIATHRGGDLIFDNKTGTRWQLRLPLTSGDR